MLWREDHERRTEERVGPGREDSQLLTTLVVVGWRGLEDDLAALGPSDPVRLHDPDRLGELDPAEIEQLVGVFRDPQIPLVEVALLDPRRTASSAGQSPRPVPGERPVVRAPVDRRLRPVGQAGLQKRRKSHWFHL